MNGKKKNIAVDLDEVLFPFVSPFCAYINKHHLLKDRTISEDDFHNYNFADILNVSNERSNEIVDAFQNSDEFKNLHPIDGAVEYIKKLTKTYNLFIVTSRKIEIKEQTEAIIKKYFDGMFISITFGNQYGSNHKKKSKIDICDSLKCVLLIDDNINYVKQMSNANKNAILFGSYPWNISFENNDKYILPIRRWKVIHLAITIQLNF